jgi:hypothetical protein
LPRGLKWNAEIAQNGCQDRPKRILKVAQKGNTPHTKKGRHTPDFAFPKTEDISHTKKEGLSHRLNLKISASAQASATAVLGNLFGPPLAHFLPLLHKAPFPSSITLQVIFFLVL